MQAVIKTGGKQYRVSPGDIIKIETLPEEVGKTVDFSDIFLVNDGKNIKVGTPIVEGAKVTGEIVEHGRAKKIHILKFKRRKHHMKRMGHRQNYTAVKITDIAAA